MLREVETPADLINEMDHNGISEGLVYHRDAYDLDFNRGNQRLARELAGIERLHLTETFVPDCSDEMSDAEGFIGRMRRNGTRVARSFPVHHNFLLSPVSCGAIIDALVASSVPLVVPLAEILGQWNGVYELLANFPGLTLVVTDGGVWGQDRFFRPLLRKYPRFYISTNRHITAGQLKGIVNDFGPDNILFGSGLPAGYPGGYVMMVARAAIPDSAKEAIAHGNIERLLGEVAW